MIVKHIDRAFQDARGSIADVLEDETIEHVTLITTAKGSVRGNHVHRATHQWLYIVSGALAYAVRADDGSLRTGTVGAGDVLGTGPMEAHALQALEDTTMVVMTRGPRGGREYESDTFRLSELLIEGEAA
ncbi:MAG: cupin domain-containing protein [Dehalococcoidia bacterium]|nr:MAG: cupin domain-containing protein [Dehalococcoidia bacterium]